MVPTRGPVPTGPLIDRWIAMLATIKYAGYRANRLARTIQRWKAAGESRPYIAPIPKTHAMHHSMALVSGGLTVLLIDALKGWPTFDTS